MVRSRKCPYEMPCETSFINGTLRRIKKMKVLTSLLLFTAIALSSQSSLLAAEKANLLWLNDYGTALKAAKDAGKPLLVILDKPTTEGEKLDLNSLTKEQTQQELEYATSEEEKLPAETAH